MVKSTKYAIKKLIRLVCPKCGELEAKLYPYAAFSFSGGEVPQCIKCVNKANAKAVVKVS